MLGFLRRRKPEPVKPARQGVGAPHVGVWTAADLLGTTKPEAEHTVTPTGQPGVHFHTWRYPTPTDAQRQAAEDAAIVEFDRSLAPAPRYPVSAPRQSIFDKFPPNGQSFPH